MYSQSDILALIRRRQPDATTSSVLPPSVSPELSTPGPPPLTAPPPVDARSISLGKLFPQHASEIDKLQTLRGVQQQQAQGEFPGSKVIQTPTGTDVLPPTEHSPSRLKAAGQGIVEAIRQAVAGGAHGYEILGAGAGGAAGGAANPRGMQRIGAERDVAKTDAEIGRQLGIQRTQAQTADLIGQTGLRGLAPLELQRKIEHDNEMADIERMKAQGMSEREAQVRAETHRHNVETESIRRAGVEKVGTKTPADTSAKASAAAQAAQAAEARGNDHLGKRKAADESVSVLRAQLEQLGPPPTDGTPDPRRDAIEADIKRAEKESDYRQSEADKAFADRDKHLQRATENAPTGKVSEDAIRKAASDAGLNPDTAVQRARKRGIL